MSDPHQACNLKLIVKMAGLALVLGGILAPMKLNSQVGTPKRGPEQATKGGEAPTGNAENGKKLYVKDGCYECHGLEGQGSFLAGPRIGPNPIPYTVLVFYVRKPAAVMPPYSEKVLSEKDLADIYAFLKSLPPARDLKDIPILN